MAGDLFGESKKMTTEKLEELIEEPEKVLEDNRHEDHINIDQLGQNDIHNNPFQQLVDKLHYRIKQQKFFGFSSYLFLQCHEVQRPVGLLSVGAEARTGYGFLC